MTRYILNAFSLNMLADLDATLVCREVSREEARKAAHGAESAVGHPDTAAVFGSELGRTVENNRVSVVLARGDTVLVGQLRGARLPEGATKLPEGAQIVWVRVTVS